MVEKGFKLDENKKISDGMLTPPAYFDRFNASMPDKLPYNPEAETSSVNTTSARTWWQASRPFIYMAAMFMGVWCMTKMFSLMKEQSPSLPFGNNDVLATALNNNDFYNDYVVDDINEYDLLSDMYDNGLHLTAL